MMTTNKWDTCMRAAINHDQDDKQVGHLHASSQQKKNDDNDASKKWDTCMRAIIKTIMRTTSKWDTCM